MIFWGVGAGLVIAPLMKGLFYEEELVLAQMYLGFIWLLYGATRLGDRETELKFQLMDYAVLAYLIVNILTIFTAVYLKEALLGIYRVFDYVLIYYLVLELTKEAKDRERFTLFVFMSTVAVSALGIGAAVEKVNFPEAFAQGRIMSSFQYPNALGICAAAGALLGTGSLLTRDALGLKAILGLGIYLNIIALLGSLSRGTWLVLGLALFIYLLGIGRRSFWKSLYHIIVIIFFGFLGSKGFLKGVYAKDYSGALAWLALGAVLLMAALSFLHILPGIVEKKRFLRRHKKVLLWALTLELILCAFIYFSYTSQILPTPVSQILDTTVIQRFGTISGEDSSYQDRMDMNRIALRIVRDYPFLGAGAGGWNSLYHQYQDKRFYWSSEVHNHYFQIWAETGTLGLVTYLAVWALLLHKIIKYLLHRKETSRWPYTWAVILAFLSILVHSGLDLELSFPAAAMVFWSLGAMVNNEVNGSGRHRSKLLLIPKPGYFILTLLIGGLLIIPAAREYRAALLSKEGVEEKQMGYYPRAIDKFEQAYFLSPLSPNPAAALAELYAHRYKSLPKETYKEKVYYYANRAIEMAPYDIKTRWSLDRAYALLGDEEALLKERERLARLLPKDPYTLEVLAQSYFDRGMAFLEKGKPLDAEPYFTQCLAVTQKIEENYLASEKRYNMRPTAQVYLLSGQVSLLLAEKKTAAEALSKALNNKDTKSQAGSLLALAYQDWDPVNHTRFYNQYIKNNRENQLFYEKIQNLANLMNGGKA